MEVLKYNDLLNESMYINKLPNGLNCYIIPKKGYVEKQAIICTNYGSIDVKFEVDGQKIQSPDGIAHFLEHKLFEDEHKCIFDEFVKLGANVNAFTNYTNTAYYFNTIDNFDESLKLLLDFTSTPYFTDENVEKEKGIITQELNMYSDNPFWKVYINLQEAMYLKSPVKKNIAGTVESIKDVNKDMLYSCYNSFYFPNNMALICVGDFDKDAIYNIANEHCKFSENKEISRIYDDEPIAIKTRYVEEKMSLSRPMFNIGFKDNYFKHNIADTIVSTRILMDIISGGSSDFFNNLYRDGLVDGMISFEYLNSSFYGTAVFSASSENPEKVCILLLDEIEKTKKQGINEERFNQIKNKHMGRFIRGFNNIDSIASTQVDLFSKEIDLFDLMNSYQNINIYSLKERLNELFTNNNYVVSVVLPKE